MVLRPERFTEQAQQALAHSQEVLRRYKHSQWDVEHILQALLEQEGGLAHHILTSLEISVESLRAQLENVLEKAPKTAYPPNQIYLTPRCDRMLNNADGEANRLRDEFIGVEHLLIAAVMEDQGSAAEILKSLDITQEKVYQALM